MFCVCECTFVFIFTQKLDGFLEHLMSKGLIVDGTVAPDITKVIKHLMLKGI